MRSLKRILGVCFIGLMLSQAVVAQNDVAQDIDVEIIGLYLLALGDDTAPLNEGFLLFYADPAIPSQVVGEFIHKNFHYTLSNVVVKGSTVTADWALTASAKKGIIEIIFNTPQGTLLDGFKGKSKTTVDELGNPVSLETQKAEWESSKFLGLKYDI